MAAHLQWRNCQSFLKKWNKISWKKTQKFEFGQTITDVLGSNTIRWTEIAFKESKKLKAVGYLEILRNHEEKLHFLDVIFQQGNATVHKSKINGDFYQKNQWRFLPRKRVSWSKTQKQLTFKSRSSAQYAYERYVKNIIFWAKKLSRRPIKMSKKNQKKRYLPMNSMIKTSLERTRVTYNAFSCYLATIQFPEVQ